MTKKDALSDFKEHYAAPRLRNGQIDDCARQQAWNDYTDSLCKGGQITLKQYEKWTNPF